MRRGPSPAGSSSGCSSFALLTLLAVQGLSTARPGGARRRSREQAGPRGRSDHPRAWGAGRPPVQGRCAPGRRIALTFDDGQIRAGRRGSPPSCAACTSRDLLRGRQRGRPASGPRPQRSTGEGFELGNHTFTHADVAARPAGSSGLQIRLTDKRARRNGRDSSSACSGRPTRPFPAAVTRRPRHVAYGRARAPAATTSCSTDFDGEDWRRRESTRSSASATSQAGAAASSSSTTGRRPLADAVARSSASCRAPRPRLPIRDGLPARGPAAKRRPRCRSIAGAGARGRVLIATLAVARWTTTILAWLLIVVALLSSPASVSSCSSCQAPCDDRARPEYEDGFTPPVSVVVPAFNEAVGIERAVPLASRRATTPSSR